ncbi:5-formyltetrahydrofolate cyclo-ligase [Cohnella nanjingensis]|uniref:5-formyltetrahydrofolate cyclo-ligase n=1 Tax=Cohnella nanjingensis TaxID=1387779 RepID=A0A7X0VHB9_9BACL|nr:5-formyltetrahydrofolate cyclo-ligase [Cohnella nanjingensis]MBB6673975.1 5-formyltetrahydrofolate cyclo-ligase [Cohnella nanjingensis]
MSAERGQGDIAKQRLRAEMRGIRDALTSEERKALSERLCRVAIEQALIPLAAERGRPLTVCAYAAFRSEADPARVLEWSWANGHRIVAPRIRDEGGGMELRLVGAPEHWSAGRWGVPAPDPARTSRLPAGERPDAVLVPGLAFDRQGGRLGYGGGYYDRLYAELKAVDRSVDTADPPVWIGFAYAAQTVETSLPKEPHDLPLDGLATEDGLIRFDKEES